MEITHATHDGPCLLGLEYTWNPASDPPPEHRERHLLAAAIDLASSMGDQEADVELALAVVDRPADPQFGVGDGRALWVSCSRGEADACMRLGREAGDYWYQNNYESDELEDARLLGQALLEGHLPFFAVGCGAAELAGHRRS